MAGGWKGDGVNARKNQHHKGARERRRRGGENDARELRRRPGRARSERVIYVACEGEQTEPDYLEYLNEEFGPGADGRRPFHLYPLVEENGLLPRHCEHGECKARNAEHKPSSRCGKSDIAGTRSDEQQTPERWSARSGHAEHCPILQRDPSTDVWRLLVSLGIVAAG